MFLYFIIFSRQSCSWWRRDTTDTDWSWLRCTDLTRTRWEDERVTVSLLQTNVKGRWLKPPFNLRFKLYSVVTAAVRRRTWRPSCWSRRSGSRWARAGPGATSGPAKLRARPPPRPRQSLTSWSETQRCWGVVTSEDLGCDDTCCYTISFVSHGVPNTYASVIISYQLFMILNVIKWIPSSLLKNIWDLDISIIYIIHSKRK